jgi:transposase InsO family protein
LSNQQKALVVQSLSGHHDLDLLLEAIKLPRSSYYYALKHPKAPTRPDVHEKAKEIFNRTNNGCGHRQILMRLRSEFGVTISQKTVLKVMRELGLVCKIRRKGFRKYSSFAGETHTVPNVIARDFEADAPFTKFGTDVTEFTLRFGKVYLAPVVDFFSNEILAFSISRSPNMEQQLQMLDALEKVLPHDAHPILHSDMGWQYQHYSWIKWLKKHNVTQSMSRKGNCLDNAATEQVFGHLKDEFFKGQSWDDFETFKRDLEAHIVHWNTKRPQVRLNGYAPSEYRQNFMGGA